jgi:hypothetical protein
MSTQWHPLFAKLLRPLVESHYEVETNMTVGDAPRAADLVLLRRTTSTPLPFQGLWRRLTIWNVLEFKGPSVSARIDDLALLVELGLGIHRRLNERRRKDGEAQVERAEMSFWYLAPQLGRRFLADARALLGPLEALGPGISRVRILGHSLLLVSNRQVPVERDSVPVHLLTKEPLETGQRIAQVLAAQPDLWTMYGAWLALTFPALWEEVRRMARRKGSGPVLDMRPLIEHMGLAEVIRQAGVKNLIGELGVKALIDEVGLKRVVDEVGVERVAAEVIAEKGLPWFIQQLTAEQRKELKRLL